MRRIALSGLFISFMAASHAQGIVDIAPQAQEGIRLGPFQNGWAYVSEGDGGYYINAQGGQIRTTGSGSASLGNMFAIKEYEQQVAEHPNALPSRVVGFEKDGLQGIINPRGEVLVPAAYDRIDREYWQFWTLFKQNKKAHYLPDGTTTAFFDDIGYLDGAYFDVKTGDAWHIYHHPSGRVITKATYEGFDYCGGCGSPAPYVYAKKNGKWGVIDWDENILVPFEYDHEHRGMRNDNWVASFSKNGRPVIVHIPTQREFAGDGELVSGMLIASQDGKQGVYNWDGELAAPFAYDRIEAPNENHYLGYYGPYLVIEKAGLKGIVRSDGEIVVPVAYEEVMVYDDYFVATKDGVTSLLAVGEATPLVEVKHGEITHIHDYFYSSGSKGLAIFKVKQQAYYGLYFAESGVSIAPEFYDVSVATRGYFADSVAVVGDRQGQKTLFNANGEAILPFSVDEFEGFGDAGQAFLSFRVRDKWGVYDVSRKKEIIPARYDKYFHALDGPASHLIRATVEENGQPDRYALYDTEGSVAVNGVFERIEPIDSTYYLMHSGASGEASFSVFHALTRALTPLPYAFVSQSSSPCLLVVSHDGRIGKLYDVAAGQELKRDYNVFMFFGDAGANASPFSGSAKDPWELSYFSEGFAQVRTGEGWTGLVDEFGAVAVEPRYARARMVHGQYALVTEVDEDTRLVHSYYLGRNGKRVFPKAYGVDETHFFNQDPDLGPVVILQKGLDGTLFGLGNLETGEILADAAYSEIMPLHTQPFLLLTQYVEDEDRWYSAISKYGLATKEGKVLFEPIFDDIVLENSMVAYAGDHGQHPNIFPVLVRQGDKWRYVNADGSYLPIEGVGGL